MQQRLSFFIHSSRARSRHGQYAHLDEDRVQPLFKRSDEFHFSEFRYGYARVVYAGKPGASVHDTDGFSLGFGYTFLIYLAGLNNIPDSVYEALDLDGAGTWKRIFFIDLPLLKSQIKYFVMLGIIGGMQSFSMQLVFTSGGPNYATTVPGYYMYEKAFFSGEFGYAAAIGFFLFLITLIITVINNKFMKSTVKFA